MPFSAARTQISFDFYCDVYAKNVQRVYRLVKGFAIDLFSNQIGCVVGQKQKYMSVFGYN